MGARAGHPLPNRRKGETTRPPCASDAMTATDASAAVLGPLSGILLSAALYVWSSLAFAAVFRKSGEQPWKAWVPVLNAVVLLQLAGLSPFLLLVAAACGGASPPPASAPSPASPESTSPSSSSISAWRW